MPAFLQPAADGAAVGIPGHAQGRLLDSGSCATRFAIHPGCAWVNYVRCHDDIGWTFSDEDAASLDINGYRPPPVPECLLHRAVSRAALRAACRFRKTPRPATAAFPAPAPRWLGWKKPLAEETTAEVELAIRRILLIHGIILTIGGIPLIYLGDEIGTFNDYAYRHDPAKAKDSRWVASSGCGSIPLCSPQPARNPGRSGLFRI